MWIAYDLVEFKVNATAGGFGHPPHAIGTRDFERWKPPTEAADCLKSDYSSRGA